MKKYLIITVYVITGLLMSSCIPPVHPRPPDNRPLNSHHTNALQVGESLPYFIDYTTALERLGISDIMKDPGPYTFFIPNANAFKVFLEKNKVTTLDEIPDQTLSQILLNHIISGAYMIHDINSGYYPSFALENTSKNPVDLYITSGALFEMNNQACIGTPDIPADNGIIQSITHVIDLPTVLDHLSYNPDFSDFYNIISRTGLGADYYSLLSGAGPLTLFAPSDTAFSRLLAENPEWKSIDNIPATVIIGLLKYSVIPDKNILMNPITTDSLLISGNGSEIKVSVIGNHKIINGVHAENAKLTIPDIQATNGVIQQLDRILMP